MPDSIPDHTGTVLSKLLDQAVDTIKNHCDSVIILTTHRDESDSTGLTVRMAGNWFAQSASLDWVLRKRHELARIEARQNAKISSRDDSEDEEPGSSDTQ